MHWVLSKFGFYVSSLSYIVWLLCMMISIYSNIICNTFWLARVWFRGFVIVYHHCNIPVLHFALSKIVYCVLQYTCIRALKAHLRCFGLVMAYYPWNMFNISDNTFHSWILVIAYYPYDIFEHSRKHILRCWSSVIAYYRCDIIEHHWFTFHLHRFGYCVLSLWCNRTSLIYISLSIGSVIAYYRCDVIEHH